MTRGRQSVGKIARLRPPPPFGTVPPRVASAPSLKPSSREWLSAVVSARAGDAAAGWLDHALNEAVQAAVGGDLEALATAYTGAPRHLGRELLTLSNAEAQGLAIAARGYSLAHWTLYDAGRAWLLLSVARDAPADTFVTAAMECYERGDAREQQSWLKAVGLLPHPERFLPAAIDACRTNIVPLFESIACENPYPQRLFPEPNFNQLVMKALFLGVPLPRIVGLPTRLNPELSRMASDFAAERRAAGRMVPGDLPLATTNGVLAEKQA